jgi:hypothetical protein
MAAFGESCRRRGDVLTARFDLPSTVHRNIRDNVGNSRPATAPDPLLDHLVGDGQQRFRDGKAECLGGFSVDDEMELCKPSDW